MDIDRNCRTCKHTDVSLGSEPCVSCEKYSKWEPGVCTNCTSFATRAKCLTCIDFSRYEAWPEGVRTFVVKSVSPTSETPHEPVVDVDVDVGVGLKYDAGKPPLSRLPREFLEQTAKVLEFGAKKYAWNNWKKGISYHRVLDAAMRHLTAFADNETIDPESGLSHLAHASCCLAFLLTYETNPEIYKNFDDRFSYLKSETSEPHPEK